MTKDKLLKTYESIYGRYLSGSLDFVLFLTIRTLYEANRIGQDDIFATTTMNSAFNTAILSLANLIKQDKDTINLHYLINSIENTKDIFDAETHDHFSVFAKEFKHVLSTITGTVDHVFVLRDKTIAHIDKKQITDPSFFLEELTTTLGDLENAYSVVESTVLEIGRYLGFNNTTLRDTITLLHLALRNRILQVFEFQNEHPEE